MKNTLIFLAVGALLFSSGTMAQMRPGAKVKMAHGLGLPRDMDKLFPPDSDYPVYPLKLGQDAYSDVDGYHIKDELKKFTAISFESQDDGNLLWGRIAGTKHDHQTTELMAQKYEKLGLIVKRISFIEPRLWYPTHCVAFLTHA